MKLSIDKVNMNYGKFTDVSFKFSPSLNIIYGENESGKSTLFRFIYSIFYGQYKEDYKNLVVDKNINDLDRPWFTNRYSGSIKFNYDGIEYYIFRDFSNGDLSVRNLTDGHLLSFDDPRELGKNFFAVNGLLFKNIVTVDLKNPWINKDDRSSLKKELTNSFTSSKNDFNLDRIRDRLIKENNNIGTDRVSKKELGQINKRIDSVTSKIADIDLKTLEISNLQKEILQEKKKLRSYENLLFYYKLINKEKTSVTLDEYYDTLELYNRYLLLKKDMKESNKNLNLIDLVFILVSLLLSLLLYLSTKNYLSFLPIIIVIIMLIFNKLKGNNLNEIDDLKKLINERFSSIGVDNIDDYKGRVSTEKKPKITIFTNPDYSYKDLEEGKISLGNSISKKERILDQYRYESQIKRNNIEELSDLIKEKNDLLDKYKTNALIIEAIDYADKMIIDNFNEDLESKIAKIVSYLTNGKYRQLLLDSDFNLYIYDEDKGDYISVYQLSSGTIETINIAFRFALHHQNSPLNLPIFLDNVSNYMDLSRKISFFYFIEDYSKENQVFFFTNDQKELDLLKEFEFNFINLSDNL